jgi:hypothetical protein
MISAVQQGVRRSGRLPITKSVQISGVNVEGRDFAAQATTLMLSRHGALIAIKQGLVPDQEVGIFNPDNALDEAARIVAMLGKDQTGYLYGVEFEDPEVDFWNISFPVVSSFPQQSPSDAASEPVAKQDQGEESVLVDGLPPLAPLLIAEVRPSSTVQPAAQKSRDFSILLKCPHDNQDEWILLRDRSEPLAVILGTRWPFDCPIHGVQMEYPVIANEGTIHQSPRDLRLRDESFADLAGFLAKPVQGKPGRVERRFPQARRVWVRGVDALGNPFSQSTYSVNISRAGARLQGLGFLAGVGVEIELKRNWKRAVYQVVWMGQPGSSLANQVGVVCLQPNKNVWGLE